MTLAIASLVIAVATLGVNASLLMNLRRLARARAVAGRIAAATPEPIIKIASKDVTAEMVADVHARVERLTKLRNLQHSGR